MKPVQIDSTTIFQLLSTQFDLQIQDLAFWQWESGQTCFFSQSTPRQQIRIQTYFIQSLTLQ